MKQPTKEQEQAIRIAVAELEGWKWSTWDPCIGGTPHVYMSKDGIFSSKELDDEGKIFMCENWDDGVPDYTRDLNAVREAWVNEIEGNEDYEDAFVDRLMTACGLDAEYGYSRADVAIFTNATALERCMALLETLAPGKLAEIMEEVT